VTSWRTVTNAVLSALIAPPCAVCASVLNQPLDGAVCDRCWASIPATAASFSLAAIVHARAIGEYEGTLREVLHALKYDGRRSVARRLSQMMADCGAHVLAGADAVVPVPLHRRRLRERGFNQSDDLARGLGLPILVALRRTRNTPPQVELPAATRRTNVRDAFVVAREGDSVTGRLANGILVLVDDVTTTGATLEACAHVLRQAGAREVRALTAARVATALR
jgi:ComF family protein